jgi:hypothetical protein
MEVAPEARLPNRFAGLFARYRFYLAALLIFAASRVVVVLALILAYWVIPSPGDWNWSAGEDWFHRLARWDTGWYHEIVVGGYRYSSQPGIGSNAPFFPLFPLLAFLLTLAGIDGWNALLLVANIASVAAILLFARVCRDELGEETALLSVACFSFFPTSFYLSAGYAESLCLALMLLSFTLMARRRFVAAGITAGFASAARITGILMLPAIVVEVVRTRPGTWPRALALAALCGGLAASGLVAFMAHHWIVFGDPMIAAVAHEPYQHGRTLLQRLVAAVTFSDLPRVDWLRFPVFFPFLALSVWSFWRLPLAMALLGLGTLLLPYLTLGATPSMGRFVILCFPAFMMMGIACKGRPALASCLIGIFGALLLMLTAFYSQWYWVG